MTALLSNAPSGKAVIFHNDGGGRVVMVKQVV